MDTLQLKEFFFWCVVINISIMFLWVILYKIMPVTIYRTQRFFFDISEDDFKLVLYKLIGIYKMIFVAVFLVPYIALIIMF